MTTYNGWKNRETWNVMLWIQNDERLYRSAVDFMISCPKNTRSYYKSFIEWADLQDSTTNDGVKWLDNKLDYRRLNEAIRELA